MSEEIVYTRFMARLRSHLRYLKCDTDLLHEYFGFTNNVNNIRKISLNMDQENNRQYMFNIESYRREASPLETYISGLPRDVNNYIHSFLVDIRKMKHLISFPLSYPFDPPTWTLQEYIVNGISKKDEEEKKEGLFCGGDWSPSLKIDKEILSYIAGLEWL
jgi:ubiquitin-protein ligase